MSRKELQDLLAKFMHSSFGPESGEGWEHDPQIEYRVSLTGARLILFGFDGGQHDLHLPIRDDDHLRAVLNGETDDWLRGDGEQRSTPQPMRENKLQSAA